MTREDYEFMVNEAVKTVRMAQRAWAISKSKGGHYQKEVVITTINYFMCVSAMDLDHDEYVEFDYNNEDPEIVIIYRKSFLGKEISTEYRRE